MSLRILVQAFLALAAPLSRRRPLRPIADALRRHLRHRRCATSKIRREAALREHGMVSPEELLAHLRQSGIVEGDTLFFQGSLNNMPTFAGNAACLLKMLRALVGADGTLLMPAYCMVSARDEGTLFDPNTPTYTGLTNELFRRSPGVLRSLHPRHSICAVGPLAETLIQGHEYCEYADGTGSPFDKLRQVPGAKILTLGLPPGYISFLHWVEDVDPAQFPLRLHAKATIVRHVQRSDGSIQPVIDRFSNPLVAVRLNYSRVVSRLSRQALIQVPYRGITAVIYPVNELATELISLRDAGIVHYSPSFFGAL